MNNTNVKSGLDAILVNALINSTKDIFLTMSNSTITVKEIKPQADFCSTGDLSAVISILAKKEKVCYLTASPWPVSPAGWSRMAR